MMNRKRRVAARWAALAALFTGSVIAGSAASAHAPSASTASATAAGDWLAHTEYTYSLPGTFANVVGDATEAVQIHVDSVDAPIFNSKDGGPWVGDTFTSPDVLSWVHATVVTTWNGAPLAGRIDFLVHGDASHRYPSVDPSQQLPPYAGISGGFDAGHSYIVLLKPWTFQFQGGQSLNAWTLASEFDGNWEILSGKSGNDAVSVDTTQTTDLATLQTKLQASWPKPASTQRG